MNEPGALLDLDVTGIAHGGVFVARHEGRVVFVADAVPGERVRARLTAPSTATASGADKRSFWRAETVEVLDASPHRRPHVWAEADVSRAPEQRPGGADLGHIAIDHQRALKRRVLQEALDRFAGGGIDAPEVEATGTDEHWRTRVTLHVDAEGRIGPFAARSHRVVPVGEHVLARPGIDAAARELSGLAEGRVELIEPADGRVRRLMLPEAERNAHRSGRGGQSGRGARGRRPARRPRTAPETILEHVGERTFGLDADGFWQIHPAAAGLLDGAVADLLDGLVDPDAAHLDLYGGVGLFAATLARLGARRITTVESSPRATGHAGDNLRDLGVEAVTARVDRFLRTTAAAAAGVAGGAVILDPPRSGAGRAVVEDVAALDPGAVVYVACDPVALARDLATFRALGFEPRRMRAFDLFPHSHHLETVALLTRER
ncbi:class I SAM-dependent RNA methyltransferase [Microbacterium capsulatum]|uniref:Class I SAM-dependent RNA methyltransferase n=1 Tax=Microbacterium capsulatum TaxID=3041921 RepID=A0ABU0XHG3_9MICO|nr:class I SAM-dependent RNA methyltransferase [Microbacterium sp. ASV81]MDQ4214506.1 class I SAM-dependent RNA methyltransferase [Microbacterium sp. ASV81]